MRVLLVSDSPALASGLARVTRELAQRFHDDGFEVGVAGWFDLLTSSEITFDYPVMPAEKQNPDSVGPILAHFKPDVVVAIGDPWDFAWLATQRREIGGFKLVGYFTVEGAPLPHNCEVVLDACDVVRTASHYGASVVGRKDVSAVHYGVDTSVFYPIPRQSIEMFGQRMDRIFCAFVNAQNTVRKNIRAAIAGFLLFAKGKSDVRCYVNTLIQPGPNDPPGVDLLRLVVELEGEPLIWFSASNRGPAEADAEVQVNTCYGMSAVLLSTSMAEGFGLTVLEAMAAGAVPIAPAAYSMPELLESGRGIQIPVHSYLRTPHGTDHVVVADADVAAALEDAYAQWKDGRLAVLAEANIAHAATKTWDVTYDGIKAAVLSERQRVANGDEIQTHIRRAARRISQRHPGSFGVLKMGGLGDMLQTTAVIRAAAQQYGRSAVVFCNNHPDIFRAMPEVKYVYEIPKMSQDVALRSLVDEFDGFLDVRYVSRGYGVCQTSAFGDRHRWFYDYWTGSCSRLETLKMHTTAIMLESLGLVGDIRPVYELRERPTSLPIESSLPIVIATGVGPMGGLKRWPIENWTALVDRLGHVAQVGGVDDELVHGAIDFRGASLPETAYLLERARDVITVEGGIAHLAASTFNLHRTVTVIYGPTPSILFSYPGFKAVGLHKCPTCWYASPLWRDAQCAIGAPSCVNFPSVSDVCAMTDEPSGLVHAY